MTKEELITNHPELAEEIFNEGRSAAYIGVGIDWQQWLSRRKPTVKAVSKDKLREYQIIEITLRNGDKITSSWADNKEAQWILGENYASKVTRVRRLHDNTEWYVGQSISVGTIKGFDCGLGVDVNITLPGISRHEPLESLQALHEPVKEWEVLEFRCGGETGYVLKGGFYYCNDPKYQIMKDVPYNGDNFLTGIYSKGYNIHSIKRLTDGEIFTVGEEIEIDLGTYGERRYPIKEFNLASGGIFILTNSGCYPHLSRIKKPKPKPLFTTQDGVPMHLGDFFWYVTAIFEINKYRTAADFVSFFNDNSRTFSTKEAAQDYITKYKPCLSYNDFYELTGKPLLTEAGIFSKLQELAKSRC